MQPTHKNYLIASSPAMWCHCQMWNCCWRRWGRTIYVISWRTSVIQRMPQIMVVCMRRVQKWLTKDGAHSLLECLMALWWALHSSIYHFFRTLFGVYMDASDMPSTYLYFLHTHPNTNSTINNLLTISICHDLALLAFYFNNFIIFENFSISLDENISKNWMEQYVMISIEEVSNWFFLILFLFSTSKISIKNPKILSHFISASIKWWNKQLNKSHARID